MRRALVALVAACASTPAASTHHTPVPTVRSEIEAAETAEKARRHDVARTHYEAAVAAAKDPESIAFARREYAETLVTWGEVTAARAQLEIVVGVAPNDPSVWHDLGIIRHHEGDITGAIVALGRAEELAPADPRPRIALAALYWKRGDKPAATREYQKLLEIDLPPQVRDKVKWALAQLTAPPSP